MKTIMVTAFEPFGLRNTPLLAENASKDVLLALAEDFGPDVIQEILPVSGGSENVLIGLCQLHRPAGILMLGEQLIQSPGEICVEPYAIDTALNYLPLLADSNPLWYLLLLKKSCKESANAVRLGANNATVAICAH